MVLKMNNQCLYVACSRCGQILKELTDEEIMNIFDNWTNSKQEHNLPANNQNYFYQEMLGFARAILRKAQDERK